MVNVGGRKDWTIDLGENQRSVRVWHTAGLQPRRIYQFPSA